MGKKISQIPVEAEFVDDGALLEIEADGVSQQATIGQVRPMRGVVPLINGQDYVDVEFPMEQASTNWTPGSMMIVNAIDTDALNILVGTIVQKTETGFRALLTAEPDSEYYTLEWSIFGARVGSTGGTDATTYQFLGPSTGFSGVASDNFTVQLLSGQTVPAPVAITPDDGGDGGTFTPASVTLPADTPGASATFTYTAASSGSKTISVTNDGGLTNPASRGIAITGSPVIDASFAAVDTTADNWDVAEVQRIGELFTSGGGTLDHAVKIIRKTGAPTGNVVAQIYAFDGGGGVGALLATSDPRDIGGLTIDAQNTFVFSGAERITLVAGTQYVIAFEYMGGDTSNKLGYWYSGDLYPGGIALTYNTIWNNLYTFDTDFEVWVIL